MNRILSLIAALVLVAGLALLPRSASAGPGCNGYLATNTCVLSQNLTDTGSGLALAGPMVASPVQLGAEGGAAWGLFGSSQIIPTASFITLTSSDSASAPFVTSTPSISTLTAAGAPLPFGFQLVLTSTVTGSVAAGYGLTYQNNSILSGSLLKLGAASRVVNSTSTLALILSSDGYWHETGYSTK